MQLQEDNAAAVTQLPTEDDIEKFVMNDEQLRQSTLNLVKENMNAAHEKQCEQYYARKNKGVKSFNLKKNDLVFKRNMVNVSRKGGKLDPKWQGPYMILDIDRQRRVLLQDVQTKKILKARCAYDQLKPKIVSELHIDLKQYESNPIIDSNINKNIIRADNKNNIEDMDDISCTKLQSSVDRFKSLAESTIWVTSDEVDDFQGLLKKHKPGEVAGLQSTLIFSYPSAHHMIKTVNFSEEPFIQILNKGGSHWVTLSNSQTSPDVCTVYDSGYNLYEYSQNHIEMLNIQISKLFHTSNDFIEVRFADVAQQPDGHNCGFYSFAYCTSLIFNDDPRNENYSTQDLRIHALNCIRDNSVIKFPTTGCQRTHNGYLSEYSIEIHCFCRMPAKNNMIRCKSCLKQFHPECVTFSQGVLNIMGYTCFVCEAHIST